MYGHVDTAPVGKIHYKKFARCRSGPFGQLDEPLAALNISQPTAAVGGGCADMAANSAGLSDVAASSAGAQPRADFAQVTAPRRHFG